MGRPAKKIIANKVVVDNSTTTEKAVNIELTEMSEYVTIILNGIEYPKTHRILAKNLIEKGKATLKQ